MLTIPALLHSVRLFWAWPGLQPLTAWCSCETTWQQMQVFSVTGALSGWARITHSFTQLYLKTLEMSNLKWPLCNCSILTMLLLLEVFRCQILDLAGLLTSFTLIDSNYAVWGLRRMMLMADPEHKSVYSSVHSFLLCNTFLFFHMVWNTSLWAAKIRRRLLLEQTFKIYMFFH